MPGFNDLKKEVDRLARGGEDYCLVTRKHSAQIMPYADVDDFRRKNGTSWQIEHVALVPK